MLAGSNKLHFESNTWNFENLYSGSLMRSWYVKINYRLRIDFMVVFQQLSELEARRD